MVSEKIYTLRRKHGLSQEQLAEKIGVSRQAISKWEGGLSTPELEKLKALSECFQITIDELTGDRATDTPDDAVKEKEAPTPRETQESRAGIFLCLIGSVCLILFGISTVVYPSFATQMDGSSTIALNGTGILLISFVLLMISGIVLILKKK